jgi:hypothetical protein
MVFSGYSDECHASKFKCYRALPPTFLAIKNVLLFPHHTKCGYAMATYFSFDEYHTTVLLSQYCFIQTMESKY